MRLDPMRRQGGTGALVVALAGSLAVAALTGALHGVVGGVLLAGALGAGGTIIWRADAIPWRDIASWTIPLVAWMAAAWFALRSDVAYLVAGALAIVWLASFMFWLAPVRWWYRWVLRKDLPYSIRSRGAAQLDELHFAVGQALQQYSRDADARLLHLRSEELLSRTVALTIDDRVADQTRALLVGYLESLGSITADPWNKPPAAFESLNDELQAFRDSLERLGGATA